jgi:hypothetical protein
MIAPWNSLELNKISRLDVPEALQRAFKCMGKRGVTWKDGKRILVGRKGMERGDGQKEMEANY